MRLHRLTTTATLVIAALILTLTTAAAQGPADHQHAVPEAAERKPQLFDNLGTYHRTITTSSAEAQRYFDQGLRLFYAFNLEEAQRSFEAAVQAAVAEGLAAGKIAARRGHAEEAVRLLRDAVETEDHLRYNEPPDWYWRTASRERLGAGRPGREPARSEEGQGGRRCERQADQGMGQGRRAGAGRVGWWIPPRRGTGT